jgi:NodT family efflux transporter outer membrane factor (OMF) lipoprotein
MHLQNASGHFVGVLTAAAAVFGLGACAGVPDLGTAPGVEPASAFESSASFTAPAAEWPAQEWWKVYNDPQLSALIEEALQGTPTLAQAQARVRKAASTAAESKSALWPHLEIDAKTGEIKQSLNQGFPPEFSQYLPRGYNSEGYLALRLDYEFDFWGKNRSSVAAAVSETRAAQAEAAEARLALSTGIASAYADLARLYAEYDVTARSVAVKEETMDLVSRRVDNGLDTRADLEQAVAGPPSERAQLAALDEQIAQSRNGIAALMGAGPDRGSSIPRPAAATLKSFGLPPQLAAALIGRRPDLIAARWRAEAAANRIGVARAAFYPNINLSAYIGQQALFANLLWRGSSQIGGVEPALTLPIFEAGRLRAEYRGARADYEDAVASYDETLVQALREVADAAVSERALSSRLMQSRAALAANEEAYRLTRMRYQGGLSNYQSVLLAEDAVLQSRLIVADLDARAFTLDVQLVQALGGGYTQT